MSVLLKRGTNASEFYLPIRSFSVLFSRCIYASFQILAFWVKCSISIIQSTYCLLTCDMSRQLESFICLRNIVENPKDRTEGEGRTLESTYHDTA